MKKSMVTHSITPNGSLPQANQEFTLSKPGFYLRQFLLLCLMLVTGVNSVWGQTDYSGTYYISSNNKGNRGITTADRFYLCPSTNMYDEDQPFVTTKKTNKGTDSKWILQFAETINGKDYYHVIHVAKDANDVNKYLTYNDELVSDNDARVRVHLQETLDEMEGHEDYNLFYITVGNVEGSVVICPKEDMDVINDDKKYRSLNPAKANMDYYEGKNQNSPGSFTGYQGTTIYCGGLIGLWQFEDNNSTWFLEEYIPRPTITNTNTQISIGHSEGNATIYYTIDGTNPTTTNYYGRGEAPLLIEMLENSATIKAIATKSDNLPSPIAEIRVVPNPTISLASSPVVYNGSEQTPAFSLLDGETEIPSSEYTIAGYSNNINAGEATVTITDNAGGDYIVYGSSTFTINPKPLTITANPQTITYGDEPTNNGVTYGEFVAGEDENYLTGTLAYTYNYEQYGDAGEYTITPGGLSHDNYAITFSPGTLTVNPKEVGLTWGETTSFSYNGLEQAPTATATGLVNGDEIGVTVTGATNVGEHTATASGFTGTKAGNYQLPEEKTQAFTITRTPLTVTANNHTITYGDAPSNDGVEYGGLVNNETGSVLGGSLSYAYTYTQYGNVGEYTITPSGLTSDNYNISFVAGTLTVNPKTMTVTAEAQSKIYGEEDPELTYTSEGLVGSDALSGTLTRAAGEDVGTYAISQGELTAGNNYTISYTGANLTITPKSIGDGNKPANGFIIELVEEGDDIVVDAVKDGEITLVKDQDYTVAVDDNQNSEKIFTISGIGNYEGSAKVMYANPVFTDPDGPGSGQAAAVYKASSDLANPTGIKPYIVRKVNPSIGTLTVTPLDYIPEDVPVLLLSDAEAEGFVASPKDESTPVITAQTENSNKLKVAPEEGVAVEAAQIYMFYRGEFVLTKAGTLSAGKFYLYNPNFTATPGEQSNNSRGILQIVIEEENVTEVDDVRSKTEEVRDSKWYTLDGKLLNGNPTKSGIYIRKGQKIFIKWK